MKQSAVKQLLEEVILERKKSISVEFREALDFVITAIQTDYKEMEKQQIIDARVNGVCEGIDIGARPIGETITEDISKNHEIYYNEQFKKK
jgi:hypothetical protein